MLPHSTKSGQKGEFVDEMMHPAMISTAPIRAAILLYHGLHEDSHRR